MLFLKLWKNWFLLDILFYLFYFSLCTAQLTVYNVQCTLYTCTLYTVYNFQFITNSFKITILKFNLSGLQRDVVHYYVMKWLLQLLNVSTRQEMLCYVCWNNLQTLFIYLVFWFFTCLIFYLFDFLFVWFFTCLIFYLFDFLFVWFFFGWEWKLT